MFDRPQPARPALQRDIDQAVAISGTPTAALCLLTGAMADNLCALRRLADRLIDELEKLDGQRR